MTLNNDAGMSLESLSDIVTVMGHNSRGGAYAKGPLLTLPKRWVLSSNIAAKACRDNAGADIFKASKE